MSVFGLEHHYEEMTLRDWFAGQIAATALGSAEGLGDLNESARRRYVAVAAAIVYEMADAMMEARTK